MDPVSQGVLGAVFAQAHGPKATLAKSAIIGAIAGMAPDLDVVIRSTSDPLLALEFHRHFSHSLLFIPIGAALCCAFLYPLLGKRWGLTLKQTYLWCLLGFATHGLLDGCTSYGTQLLWPLTNHRFAWDIISIIDPLVTIPLLALVYLASKTKKRLYTYTAIVWLFTYFSFGILQHQRAITLGTEYAKNRNIEVKSIAAKPSLGNLVLWKLIFETEEGYHVDAIKLGINTHHFWQGKYIQKLNYARDLSWLDLNTQQAKDIERFRWFSGDYIALDPNNSFRVVDIRYSLLPNDIKPLWGIELSPTASQQDHALFESVHERPKDAFFELMTMIFR